MKEVAIGVDLGGTYTKLGIVDRKGNALLETYITTQIHLEIRSFIRALHEKIEDTLSSINETLEVKGIGIGAPNGNYYRGTIEHAPNLQWKGVINFCDMLKEFYADIPIVLTNDANAAAIGEMIYGGAKGMSDFIVITLGTGLGSGIVANNQLVYGSDGFAGELGHTIAVQDGRQCGCGNRGCLETYASASGIRRTVFELLCMLNNPSELRNVSFEDLNAKMISEAAKRGDPIALAAFEFTGEMLGKKLAESVAVMSPESIFLFGGLAMSGDLIFKPTHHHMEKNLLNVYKGRVKLLPSGLQGTNAAILGASALVWKEIE